MGGKFKFQAQDSFLEYFFLEIWRSKKRIALSEKKPPLAVHFDWLKIQKAVDPVLPKNWSWL